ncbi:uncharacterized protein ACA1_227740 [Acanthamoeba castellanii str. Neff]|uniref:Leucine rich repeat domain containing protein n=1 Tax=Acanthamoeba castellanii (strain ATCC 30010 / Neff) TaxID=1257118 RepID=L8HA40_ACACF|nr:uncharacterized protein ACA1_227740 [Acanthamoeba castellanii str. Neff]ELR21573.1 hypothetical protein ACA1_227740 [Acanthamoeba castellanii str. Neff]
MGGCFGKGLTKTEMAIVEARALQKHDHDVNEVNLLLDDPFPSHVWEEITSLLRLPHNRQQIELLQVRPDEYWDAPTSGRAALGDQRIETLAAALANSSTEERAWRDAAQIAMGDGGSDGSEQSQEAPSPPALKSLYLDFNNIGPDGAKHLARMIHLMDHRQACALATLSLNNNRIGDEGAIALARAIRGNHSLQRIFLRDNAIGPAGSQALADAVAANGTLLEVDMAGNQGEAAIQSV